MKNVLKEIIGPDQKGFLKDRYIEENTRLVYDLMQYCKETHREGMLLLIDFEKAFDSIEWSYIEKVLSKYNFGNDFIKWFKIVYKNAQSCVINNGKYSDFFLIGAWLSARRPLVTVYLYSGNRATSSINKTRATSGRHYHWV